MTLSFSDFLRWPKWCISLDGSERWASAQARFDVGGLKVQRSAGVDPVATPMPELCEKTPGAWGCAAAHARLLYKIGRDWIPNVVFEDDVTFCEDFAARVEYLASLGDLEADGFLLGGHLGQEPPATWTAKRTDRRHVYRVGAAGGTYAYVVSPEVARFVARNWTYRWGADEFFTRFVYPRFRVLAMVPFLCGTEPNRSAVTGATFEYPNVGWYYRQAPFDLAAPPFLPEVV